MKRIGRLALRVEGNLWVAYYALPNTMEGAIRLADIQMRFVLNQERKQAFIDLMREAVGDLIEDETGVRPEWPHPLHSAPEHEKAGRS